MDTRFSRWLARGAVIVLMGCGGGGGGGGDSTTPVELTGQVRSGDTPGGVPLVDATVTLYRAGTTRRSGATVLGTATTDSAGRFLIDYDHPSSAQAVLYLVADLPDDRIRLAAVLGNAIRSTVVVNERTTVATAFAMAQFIDQAQIGGKYPGVQNAAETAGILADAGNGDVASVLAGPPNGELTPTWELFNSLANMIAACVQDPANCAGFFAHATTGGPVPDDTLEAMTNVARHPGGANAVDPTALFADAQIYAPYAPALAAPPSGWMLAVLFWGDGVTINGPGNIALDADGNAWISNNYEFSLDPADPDVCGDDHLVKLTPTGAMYPGSPYQGGGLYGAGFGICLDRLGDVWVTNFGFQGVSVIPGEGCTEDPLFLAGSVSHFAADGFPLSPGRIGEVFAGGYPTDAGGQPQGVTCDRSGNIWIANACTNSISVFVPGSAVPLNFSGAQTGILKPFDVAVDTHGTAWFTSNNNNSAIGLAFNGGQAVPMGSAIGAPDGTTIRAPMGIATDSLGNVWVSNSGVIQTPCDTTGIADAVTGPDVDVVLGAKGAGVTVFNSETPGATETYRDRAGIYLPWGIAVDGLDNVWVANFGGQRLAHLCGARPGSSPGLSVGDAISPSGGYAFVGLVRNTGVQIAPSGNVWLTNNWETDPVQTNPGGKTIAVFVGIAEPVETPLIGATTPLDTAP